jgi:hypothetical protein
MKNTLRFVSQRNAILAAPPLRGRLKIHKTSIEPNRQPKIDKNRVIMQDTFVFTCNGFFMSTAQSLNISPELSAFVLGQAQNIDDVEAYLRRLVEEDMRLRQEAREWLLEKLRPALEADESEYIEMTEEEILNFCREK